MNVNDPRIPRVRARDDDAPVAGAYKRQHYYKQTYADQLASVIAQSNSKPGSTISFSTATFDGKATTLKLMLNCSRAFILNNPEMYDDDIVQTLLHGAFIKERERYVFKAQPTPSYPGSNTRTSSLAFVATITDMDGEETRPVETPAITAGPGIPNAPAKVMAFLPDDGDIDTLLFNLEAFNSSAQPRQLFIRDNIRLSDNEISRIKERAVSLKLVGYAKPTAIKYAKV